jgi:hypothetical protein
MAYTYDLFGNRETLTVTGGESYTVSYSYDLNKPLLSDEKADGASRKPRPTHMTRTEPAGPETSTYAPAGRRPIGHQLSGDIDPVAVYGYNGLTG